MLQNYNKWKVLKLFFDQPLAEGGFQLREISRKVKLALPSVKNYLSELAKEGLIMQKNSRVQSYPVYSANRDDEHFKFYKKVDLLERIKETGLLKDIHDLCNPHVVILFGSGSRGEDTEHSDLDIFIQAPEKKINLNKYKPLFHREINFFFEENFSKLNRELKNNILNGLILKGYLKVF